MHENGAARVGWAPSGRVRADGCASVGRRRVHRARAGTGRGRGWERLGSCLRCRDPRRARARWRRQSVDRRRRRHSGWSLRTHRQGVGNRQDRARRAWTLRVSGLDRHDGPVGGGAPQERAGADQSAGGGDSRHRRRGRPTGPDRLAGRLFPSSRATGDQHQFRDVCQRGKPPRPDPGSRWRAIRQRPSSTPCARSWRRQCDRAHWA